MTEPEPTPSPTETRAIELEAEVVGTPEQVWDAIATGPGITSWFVPTTVVPEVGGEVRQSFGVGEEMQVEGRVQAWEPPHRFVYGEHENPDGGLAFEFLVEARDGGSCVVRLVNSGFGTGEEWDGQYDGMEKGWRLFLQNLRMHLAHFPGQEAAVTLAMGMAMAPAAEVWSQLVGALGTGDLVVGQRVRTGPGAPATLAGEVRFVADGVATVLLDEPAAGTGLLAAEPMGPGVAVSVQLYLYGEAGAAATERDAARWQAWLAEQFPMPEPPDEA